MTISFVFKYKHADYLKARPTFKYFNLSLIYIPNFLYRFMSTTILLVEDNELNRDMLSRRLERKGYVIQMAADGAQGVSMATELRPALILMDLSLPVMDGWEAIRRLKADPETAAIPIIALTAHARAEDETTAREAGANDFDTKPIDLNRLVGKIENLLTPPATATLPENP